MVKDIKIPFLCIHGTDDAVTYPTSSHYLIENAATESAKKQLKLFQGLKHEMCHEKLESRTEVMNYCHDYLNNQLK